MLAFEDVKILFEGLGSAKQIEALRTVIDVLVQHQDLLDMIHNAKKQIRDLETENNDLKIQIKKMATDLDFEMITDTETGYSFDKKDTEKLIPYCTPCWLKSKLKSTLVDNELDKKCLVCKEKYGTKNAERHHEMFKHLLPQKDESLNLW